MWRKKEYRIVKIWDSRDCPYFDANKGLCRKVSNGNWRLECGDYNFDTHAGTFPDECPLEKVIE